MGPWKGWRNHARLYLDHLYYLHVVDWWVYRFTESVFAAGQRSWPYLKRPACIWLALRPRANACTPCANVCSYYMHARCMFWSTCNNKNKCMFFFLRENMPGCKFSSPCSNSRTTTSRRQCKQIELVCLNFCCVFAELKRLKILFMFIVDVPKSCIPWPFWQKKILYNSLHS